MGGAPTAGPFPVHLTIADSDVGGDGTKYGSINGECCS